MFKNVWILTGNLENWEVAVSDKVWGVREGRLKKQWNKIEKGDILFFYAKSPISGLIGVGAVESKFKQDKPLWPDEISKNEVIYPYRFGFIIIHYVAPRWKGNIVGISDLKTSILAGLNSVSNKKKIDELIRRVKGKWDVVLPDFLPEEDKISSPKPLPSIHNVIRDKLYEIGQIENFISEKEYSIDGERLDVTWRRVARGVPTKVFEVQVSGSIHQALAKLKHAFDLWNSEPFLIIDKKHAEKASELLAGTFHEINPYIRVITLDKVEQLYKQLISTKSLFNEFGL